MMLQRMPGASPAGKRIYEAGLRFQEREQPQPSPRKQSVATRLRNMWMAEAHRERILQEVERTRLNAIQKAIDGNWSGDEPATNGDDKSLREIITETATWHGFNYGDLIGKRRFTPVVWARQEAMWRCVAETSHTLPEIGRAFGGKDHTTVICGVRSHARRNDLPLPRGMLPEGKGKGRGNNGFRYSPAEVQAIGELWRSGLTGQEIADRLTVNGKTVSRTTILGIISRHRRAEGVELWPHRQSGPQPLPRGMTWGTK